MVDIVVCQTKGCGTMLLPDGSCPRCSPVRARPAEERATIREQLGGDPDEDDGQGDDGYAEQPGRIARSPVPGEPGYDEAAAAAMGTARAARPQRPPLTDAQIASLAAQLTADERSRLSAHLDDVELQSEQPTQPLPVDEGERPADDKPGG